MDTEVIEIVLYQPWQILLISAILFSISKWCKGRMDKSGANAFNDWRDKTPSQNNKYKLDENGWVKPYIKKWYHPKWWTPKFEEKHPFSTTALVFLTDYWHFMQFIMLNTASIGICILISPIWWVCLISFVVSEIIYGIWFNFGYELKGFKIKVFRK
jgi:hypothetical protein